MNRLMKSLQHNDTMMNMEIEEYPCAMGMLSFTDLGPAHSRMVGRCSAEAYYYFKLAVELRVLEQNNSFTIRQSVLRQIDLDCSP